MYHNLLAPRLLCPLLALHSLPLPQFSPRLLGSVCGRCLLMRLPKKQPVERSKGTENVDLQGRLLGVRYSFRLCRVVRLSRGGGGGGGVGGGPPSGLGWERSVGKRRFGKGREDLGRALKVRTHGCDYCVKTTPLIVKLHHFRLPASSQGKGVRGAKTREKTAPPAAPSPPIIRPGGPPRHFQAWLPAQSQAGRSQPHVCPRGLRGGGREAVPSRGQEASGWAVTLSPSVGAPHLLPHPSPTFPENLGVL